MILTLENRPVPREGDVAPDFNLPSTAGRDISLAEFRGEHVLLAFFPLAFTSTCTAEMCAFTDDYSKFVAAGVRILPISVDSTATLKEYKAKYSIPVDMASDFRRAVSVLYGVLHEERFYSQRAYFLVDGRGVVRWAHVERVPGDRRHNEEILRKIAAVQAEG